MEYIKVIGIQSDALNTEIVEDTNKGDIDEVAQFIKEHPHPNTTWILKPMSY